ncbi:MAG: FAD-binding oxidoreductase [Steroidobacteraceae bacterium]
MADRQSPLDLIRARLGGDAVLTAAADVEPFLVDQRALYHGHACAVVAPRTVDEVTALLAVCNEQRIGVVPQGGNTSYCGGATPDESGRQIVLALHRLDRIRELDATGYTLVAEAGCTLEAVRRAAESADRLFPLALGSQGSCRIGGNIATNAGGTQVLRYGMMRDLILGLEVVLADGRVLSSLTALRKDNTGYDLKSLFLGSEGTLGVITAASLKLFPSVRAVAAAFIAVPDARSAVDLLAALREASGELVSSFELIPRIAIELATRHIPGVVDPLAGKAHPWYVLCEIGSSRSGEPCAELLEGALGAELERGRVLDAALASSERERAAFWRLRESIPEAQRRDGASLKHDISVPIARLPELLERGSRWVSEHVPDGRLVAYGHVGDGNLHFNLNQAPGSDAAAFLARGPAVMRAVHDLAASLGGSLSAEHGIGRLKVAELERYAQPVELELMRSIKHVFDPNGILNPGKVLRAEPRDELHPPYEAAR